MRPITVYCANTRCPSRANGRTFTVIDTTDMSAGERAGLLIEGADTFKTNDAGEQVQVSKARPRFDGELTDGEPWLCPDCAGAA